MLLQQVWLGLLLLAAWLVLSLFIPLLSWDFSSIWLAIAALVCFLPGCVVLLAQPMWKSFQAVGFGAMGGSVLRILFVAGAMLVVVRYFPSVPVRGFGIALSVFYLVSLAVETGLMVGSLKRHQIRSA